MKIGELAKKAGCQVETVRYYEREGLLPAPARSEGNYRLYGPEHLERLVFIRNCRTLDMTLEEIQRLLALRDLSRESCADINDLVDEHIEHVQARINSLQALRDQLLELRDRCNGTQERRPARFCVSSMPAAACSRYRTMAIPMSARATRTSRPRKTTCVFQRPAGSRAYCALRKT